MRFLSFLFSLFFSVLQQNGIICSYFSFTY
ncbi:hypothetical protein P3W86_13150 [Staphylococcus aureus]|nr:hypothetical protein [Staphylococcus aureus]MBZ5337268.1 hypothetical protein [Staphylococcus aureus]MDF4046438.1 hypothetical protein [Staphylococcus aureus]HDE0665641.1 hypothetical protein [Staphylococcus aureus]HDJ2135067.1 hypothetical protein [Staphylococcus aureus]HDZ3325580.1 hypothetical protein [Staphylococcus aureus]